MIYFVSLSNGFKTGILKEYFICFLFKKASYSGFIYKNMIKNVLRDSAELLLGGSASRGMRQTFSCLSKLGGTTNLIRFLFDHVK